MSEANSGATITYQEISEPCVSAGICAYNPTTIAGETSENLILTVSALSQNWVPKSLVEQPFSVMGPKTDI